MGLYNKYEKYNADEEAARRKVAMDTFLASDDTHLLMLDEEPEKTTVKIENNKGFYSADCPYCGKIKILSGELKTLSAVCNGCYCAFNLEN